MELDNGDGVVDPHAADEPTTAVAGKPGPEASQFDVTEDGNQVKHGGKTYVREEALHAERSKAQKYAQTLGQLEPLMPEFEQFLKHRQGGERATVDRVTRPVQTDDYSEDELNGYAITRGYYDAENKPDLKRAKADLDIMTAVADRRATRANKPVLDSVIADRARENAERAMAATFVDGQPIADPQYMKAAFDAVPDQFKADGDVSNMVQVIAAGLQALDERRTGKRGNSRREPVFREGGGSRVPDRTADALDALDLAAARARGKSPEQWAKQMKATSGGNAGGTILEGID